MSVLFQKINKPRQWDYRPIYYDEEKYERQKRLESMKTQAQKEAEQALHDNTEPTYHHSLHRGSFREARDNNSMRVDESKKANKRFVIILGLLLLVAALYWVLS